jgi:c-di-GMP-binding flagellar brake protein YcgR
MLETSGFNWFEGVCVRVNGKVATGERRQWPRLALAIPVFVRSCAESDKEFLEFATALNVSAGGMLVAVRRSIPSAEQVSLEIPSAPLAALADLPPVTRNLRAKVLRMKHGEGYNLVGLKFSRPLHAASPPARAPRRKVASSM